MLGSGAAIDAVSGASVSAAFQLSATRMRKDVQVGNVLSVATFDFGKHVTAWKFEIEDWFEALCFAALEAHLGAVVTA